LARPKSPTYKLLLRLVLVHEYSGIKYDELVKLTATSVEYQRAKDYRLKQLSRTPNETNAETIWKGQKAIARKYIDAAKRAGRIRYIEKPFERIVKLGRPPQTGGAYSRERTWAEEKSSLSYTE
jgi:hypothetical protein